MDIKRIIASAAHNLHTILITSREKDNTVETREAEPYSYRMRNGQEIFFCYDIIKGGTRSFFVVNIISVTETDNSFIPRWPIEL